MKKKSDSIQNLRKELDRIHLPKYSTSYNKRIFPIEVCLGLEIVGVSRSKVIFKKRKPNEVHTYEESITSANVSRNIIDLIIDNIKNIE